MTELTIRLVQNTSEYQRVISLRKTVFVREQKVPLAMEIDEFEKDSQHVIVLLRNKPIGCARLRTVNGSIKLERLCILKKYRGFGYGKEILQWMIDFALLQHPKNVYMHAQAYLIEFYKKFNFEPYGNIFDEAGIQHIEMRLRLKKSKMSKQKRKKV
jgi:predicted GNAT family N-acyltransferase